VKDVRLFGKPEGFKGKRDSQRPYSAVKQWQGLEMKGTVLDHIPMYNDFFNFGKEPVFPL